MSKIQLFGISCLFLVIISSFGQDTMRNNGLMLYTNFDFNPMYLYMESETMNDTTRVIYQKEWNGFSFSPAFIHYNKKDNSSEIEISRLKFENDYVKEYTVEDSTGEMIEVLSGAIVKQFELFLRYEYKVRLFKDKDWEKINPSIGFSATPFFKWYRNDPLVTTEFSSSNTDIGVYFSVIPGIEYCINDKWYIGLNMPLAILTACYTTITNDNPIVSVNERKQSSISYYNLPVGIAIRIGIGFRI